MALVPCQVSPGLRDQEATVEVVDYHDQKEYLPIDRAFLVNRDGHAYLPVRVLHVNQQEGAALVALPVEADSGAHRIWVKLAALAEPERATA